MKKSNFQTEVFSIIFMIMNEHTYTLFKNILNDVQPEGKGEINTAKQNILRKTIEGYLNSFDNIIFDEIIFKQSIFVSNRTNNMHFSKMQNKISGPMVTIQYHNKCTNPLYPRFTSKNFSVFIRCYNLYLVIVYALIPTTDKLNTHFFSNCT